jgi:hypothetical protein
MAITPLSLRSDYWDTYQIQEQDLQYLYNYLLEHETPQTPQELVSALIVERIRQEKENLSKRHIEKGEIYRPKEHYQTGQSLLFPTLEWKQGQVTAVRAGHNPEYPPFEVIQVEFGAGETQEFAAGFGQHVLNQPVSVKLDDPQLDPKHVVHKYGARLATQLSEILESNPDLVKIAWSWFPRSLLVDVNIGHLNLAEAVLDMAGGGPLTTHALLEQIDLPTDVNAKLTEFSLNLALQEDDRFDEVGPAGEIIWFLRRLEPDQVQNLPIYLKYNPSNYDPAPLQELLQRLDNNVVDEIEAQECEPDLVDENDLTLSLIFPHWCAGTLPLTKRVARFFPTAYESPRVQFTFVDGDTGQKFSGWVVRASHYIYGLKEWYASQNLIPGSIIHIRRGKKPGEVIIKTDKHRTSREWIRTALIGADGGIVFAMLKQVITCNYDERMAIAISDPVALERLWESGNRSKQNIEQVVLGMMRELAKLTPQSHVHFQELYSSVNLLRRCPPSLILSILTTRPWARHLGDFYFRLEENKEANHQDE